jgi:hypothetical protein
MIRHASTGVRAGFIAIALWVGVCSSVVVCGSARASGTAPVQLAPDAPERYTVVRGDTLWGIAGRFLNAPWQWPEIWALNREQIANPHLIYPGDVIVLDRSGPEPRLRLSRGTAGAGALPAELVPALRLERLQPQMRADALPEAAIPTLPLAAIEPFLNRPWVLEPAALAAHPRIVATQDGRLHLSRGDLAYARGLPESPPAQWHVYRPARQVIDPATRQTLGWETLFVGTARLVRAGDPATFQVEASSEEIGEGDRLVPAVSHPAPRLAPRAPDRPLEGRIVSVYRGIESVGRHNVVAVSLGSQAGLEVGHVLRVLATGRTIIDRETREPLRLPNEPIGELVVFRVFDHLAYGLITRAAQAISVGATVATPTAETSR